MYCLWVYLTVTLVFGEKLDRAYLPPLGYASSGGSDGAIDFPLELPNFSFVDEYTPSEIAIGIDRGDPNENKDLFGNFSSPKASPILSEDQGAVPLDFTNYSQQDFSKNPEIAIGIDRGGLYKSIDLIENISIPSNDKSEFKIPNTNNFVNTSSPTSFDMELPVNNYENFKYSSYNFSNPSDYPIPEQNTYDKNLPSLLHNKKFSYGDTGSGYTKTTLTPFEVDFISNKTDNSGDIHSVTYPISMSPNIQQYDFISSKTPFSPTTAETVASKGHIPLNQATHPPETEKRLSQFDKQAVILNYDQFRTPGSYAYNFETSNGIHVNENGTNTNGVKAEGSYSYVGDDGEVYSIIYTADENGFHPRGAHLPTSPPIPDAILKVIEHAKKQKKTGDYDDGFYDDNKYGYRKYQSRIENQQQNEKKNHISPKTNKADLFHDYGDFKNNEESFEDDNFNQNYEYSLTPTYSDVTFPPENRFYDDKTLKTFPSRFSETEQDLEAKNQEFVNENVTAKPFLTPYVSRKDDNIENYDSENYKESEPDLLNDEFVPKDKPERKEYDNNIFSSANSGYFYNKNTFGSTIPTDFPPRFSSSQTYDFSDVASLNRFEFKTTTGISAYSDENREKAATAKSVHEFSNNPRQNQGFDPLTGYYY